MSIIKGKTNIVAGFGGTKRPLGEVYFSQSSLASDNPGALPAWTGEYYENGKTLFPDLYNFVKAHSELQVTKAQYDSAIATYGECPKYVVDENTAQTSLRLPKRQTTGRYLVKKEVNGNDWYALYSDGWLEQGRYWNPTTNTAWETISLLKPFANTNYYLNLFESDLTSQGSAESQYFNCVKSYARTTTNFKARTGLEEKPSYAWEAKGYAAGTPMENIKYPWLVAYTSAVPASTAQAAEFTGALSGKANTDLSNVLANIDYVVESQVNSDGSWYRKYKSGWLEQGGISAGSTVTFLKSFANTNYTLTLGHEFGNASDANIWLQFAKNGKTTTGFTYANATTPANTSINWEAKGMGAN